jgi:site-specific DNA recombinase
MTRSLSDWQALLAVFGRHGVGLSLTTGELGDPHVATTRFMMNVLGAFSEFERGIIQERLREARSARRQHGLRSAGLVPFGFASAKATRQLEPVPAERDVIRHVFETAATGSKPAEIASWLNRLGITTKQSGKVGGKPWTARAVLRLLQNRVYLGEIGGTRATHDAVIEAALFEQANAQIRARRSREPGRRGLAGEHDAFLLRGLLRCTRCGRLMTTAVGQTKQRRAEAPRFYRCRGLEACTGTQVAAGEFEQRVVRWLLSPEHSKTSADTSLVLSTWRSLWPLLRPQTIRMFVRQAVWEVGWDARRDRIEVMVDDIAFHELAEAMRPRSGDDST